MTVQRKRHLAKAITWRIVASLTTFAIGWGVTGDMHFGMAIGAADVVIKIILYYLHERAWYHSEFGVVKNGINTGSKPLYMFFKKIRQVFVFNKKNK